MKIGIFLHPFGERAPAGLGRAIFEWTRSLLSIDRENEYIIFVKHAPAAPLNISGNFHLEVLGGGIFWMDRARRRARADVYLFNTPVLPFLWRPPRSVVIALDFAYCYPEFRENGLRERLRAHALKMHHARSLARADRIVAISESARQDACKFFSVPEEKINVIPLGFKNVCLLPERPLLVSEKFFLFVGVFKKRKNVMGIVRAFARVRASYPDVHLVLAGRADGAYADRVRSYITDEKIGGSVHIFGHVKDAELSFLYKNALSLVFPSFLEGFGFPVLEAMACELPVITSRVSSLPEVAGDAALLADPRNPEEIAAAMKQIVSDSALRAELIKKGRERAAHFSWEKAARELLSIVKTMQ